MATGAESSIGNDENVIPGRAFRQISVNRIIIAVWASWFETRGLAAPLTMRV
jgi:hypothetical protein